MKIKILVLLIITFCVSSSQAQEKAPDEGRFKYTVADKLRTQFYNKVYRCFYNPDYMTNTTTTAAVLKVDIDKSGKVSSIIFSDSADAIFKNAFAARKNIPADFVTLEKYAAMQKIANQSLLIPVYFEPKYPEQSKVFTYDELEGLWKFESKFFTGNSIIMPSIFIRVGRSGNM